jgi:hypothetical protein
MSDADEFGLLGERYVGPLVLKPDHARALRRDAAMVRSSSKKTQFCGSLTHFSTKCKPANSRYYDTICERPSME